MLPRRVRAVGGLVVMSNGCHDSRSECGVAVGQWALQRFTCMTSCSRFEAARAAACGGIRSARGATADASHLHIDFMLDAQSECIHRALRSHGCGCVGAIRANAGRKSKRTCSRLREQLGAVSAFPRQKLH